MLNRGEKCDTYLTHVCRLLQNVDSLERIGRKQKLSANTVALSAAEVNRP